MCLYNPNRGSFPEKFRCQETLGPIVVDRDLLNICSSYALDLDIQSLYSLQVSL